MRSEEVHRPEQRKIDERVSHNAGRGLSVSAASDIADSEHVAAAGAQPKSDEVRRPPVAEPPRSYLRIADASRSKRGRPLVPSSTIFIVCVLLWAKRHQNTVAMLDVVDA